MYTFWSARAVKRPHGRLPLAAGRVGGAAKQHQARLAVRRAAPGELLLPHILGIGQHGGHKLRHAVVRRRALRGRLLHLRGGRAFAAEQAQDGERVDAEDPAAHQRDHDGAHANATPAQQATPAQAAAATAVLDVAGFTVAFPLHDAPRMANLLS
jgi:hypothetical protein